MSSPAALPAIEPSAGRAPFMGFATDEVTRALLDKVAGEHGWGGAVREGGVAEAASTLAGLATPSLLVIDLTDADDPLADMAALAEVCDAGTRVVALGTVNDVGLFRDLMASGVQDYLLKPVSAESLAAAMARPVAPTAVEDTGGEGTGVGKVIAVVGARGGAGASTVAVNTAWLMAHEQGLRVALVDLDLYFGTAALALDLEPGCGFREALENPDRIDGLFIERAMVRAADRLFVLGAEEDLGNRFSFDPAALDRLLETLRADFDCVVVDLPRFAARSQAALLAPPAAVVVVSDPSLAGMRDTARLVAVVKATAPEAAVKVLLNRVGAAKVGELTKDDFERGAELSVDAVIPWDVKAAAASAGVGKAMAEVAARAKPVAVLRDLGGTLAGSKAQEAAPPLWSRLLKKRSG